MAAAPSAGDTDSDSISRNRGCCAEVAEQDTSRVRLTDEKEATEGSGLDLHCFSRYSWYRPTCVLSVCAVFGTFEALYGATHWLPREVVAWVIAALFAAKRLALTLNDYDRVSKKKSKHWAQPLRVKLFGTCQETSLQLVVPPQNPELSLDLSEVYDVWAVAPGFLADYTASADGETAATHHSSELHLGYVLNEMQSIPDRFCHQSRFQVIRTQACASKISSIGHSFLLGCTGLQEINLTFLSNVTQIGNSFLQSCQSLTYLDLRPLSNIVEIRDNFLRRCEKLQAINMDGFTKVQFIGKSFLQGCSALEVAPLSPFASLISIGDSFLSECRSLRAVNCRSLHRIAKINSCFLMSCALLETVDFEGCGNVQSIAPGFLGGCSRLKVVFAPSKVFRRELKEKVSSVAQDLRILSTRNNIITEM